MTELFILRDRINHVVREYETWFLIIAKFIGMMFVFTYVNSSLGYFAVLDSMAMNVLLSLICSIIPGGLIVFIVAAVIMAHIVRLSVLLAILVLAVMLIVYLMFLKFAPGQSAVLLAVPVLMQYDFHFAVPILAGLVFTPYAAVPAALGMFMVKFLGYTCEASSLTGTGMSFDLDGLVAALNSIIGQISADKEVWFFAIVAAITMAVLFIISQFSFDYAWYVAIAAAAVAEIAAAFSCAAVLGVNVNIPGVIISTLIGGLIAALLQFMKCSVDYSRKEYVQFEDDDYYYYVKAIPKISVPRSEVNVLKMKASEGAGYERSAIQDDEE